MNKDVRVARVRKALDKFVPANELKWPLRGCAISQLDDYAKTSIIRLSDGRWTLGGHCHNIDGCICGYNTTAISAAYGLSDLRYFSKDDAIAFHEWWREQDRHQQRESEKRKMQESAVKFGYLLKKRKES